MTNVIEFKLPAPVPVAPRKRLPRGFRKRGVIAGCTAIEDRITGVTMIVVP